MTKRKILAAIAALLSIIAVLCTACSESDSSDSDKKEPESIVVVETTTTKKEYEGGLVLIEKKKIENELYQFILYDAKTKVVYVFIDGNNCGGLSVLYNEDGSLKTYSPNAETE